MKKFLICLTSILFSILIFSMPAQSESTLVGTWKQVEDQGANKGKVGSYIEMSEQNGVFVGKIVKLLLDPPDKV